MVSSRGECRLRITSIIICVEDRINWWWLARPAATLNMDEHSKRRRKEQQSGKHNSNIPAIFKSHPRTIVRISVFPCKHGTIGQNDHATWVAEPRNLGVAENFDASQHHNHANDKKRGGRYWRRYLVWSMVSTDCCCKMVGHDELILDNADKLIVAQCW